MHTMTKTNGSNDRPLYVDPWNIYFFCNILSHHECNVSSVNPLYQNVMKYCLNITHYQFTTGSSGLKLFNVSAIVATT